MWSSALRPRRDAGNVALRGVIGGWDASHPPIEEGEEGREKLLTHRIYDASIKN
jgi:hypothetical protein